MQSNAKQIKDRFVKLLDDGLSHSRKELFAYAKEDEEENTYTIGVLAGALKTLVDSCSMYHCIERGIYQKIEPSEKTPDDIISEYLSILKKTLEKANRNLVDPFSLLEMDQEE